MPAHLMEHLSRGRLAAEKGLVQVGRDASTEGIHTERLSRTAHLRLEGVAGYESVETPERLNGIRHDLMCADASISLRGDVHAGATELGADGATQIRRRIGHHHRPAIECGHLRYGRGTVTT